MIGGRLTLTHLTLADLSLLGGVAAYMAPIAIAKLSAARQFDNAKPRDEAFFRDPFRARALWAHRNGIEGYAFFAAAVVVAELRDGRQATVDGLAIGYVALRFGYAAAYLGDRPRLRSALWGLAFAANVALLLSPLGAR
jgi:uncharacterized MAPEG superfamily protein